MLSAYFMASQVTGNPTSLRQGASSNDGQQTSSPSAQGQAVTKPGKPGPDSGLRVSGALDGPGGSAAAVPAVTEMEDDLLSSQASEPGSYKQITVAVGGGVSGRGWQTKPLKDLPLVKILGRSLLATASPGVKYILALCYDVDDPIFAKESTRAQVDQAIEAMRTAGSGEHVNLRTMWLSGDNAGKPSIAHAMAMEAAAKAGADFLYRVNDDTELRDAHWTEHLVAQLLALNPPLLGMVAPGMQDSDPLPFTAHDFVHVTHLDVFDGQYYPRSLPKWHSDNWIGDTYRAGRAVSTHLALQYHHVVPQRYDAGASSKSCSVNAIESERSRAMVLAWAAQHPHGISEQDVADIQQWLIGHTKSHTERPGTPGNRQQWPPAWIDKLSVTHGAKWIYAMSIHSAASAADALINVKRALQLLPMWTVTISVPAAILHGDEAVQAEWLLPDLRDAGADLVAAPEGLPPAFGVYAHLGQPGVQMWWHGQADQAINERLSVHISSFLVFGIAHFTTIWDHPSVGEPALPPGLWGGFVNRLPALLDDARGWWGRHEAEFAETSASDGGAAAISRYNTDIYNAYIKPRLVKYLPYARDRKRLWIPTDPPASVDSMEPKLAVLRYSISKCRAQSGPNEPFYRDVPMHRRGNEWAGEPLHKPDSGPASQPPPPDKCMMCNVPEASLIKSAQAAQLPVVEFSYVA